MITACAGTLLSGHVVGGGQDAPLAHQLKATRERTPGPYNTCFSLAESHSSFGASDRGGSFGRPQANRMRTRQDRTDLGESEATITGVDCRLFRYRAQSEGSVTRKTARRAKGTRVTRGLPLPPRACVCAHSGGGLKPGGPYAPSARRAILNRRYER